MRSSLILLATMVAATIAVPTDQGVRLDLQTPKTKLPSPQTKTDKDPGLPLNAICGQDPADPKKGLSGCADKLSCKLGTTNFDEDFEHYYGKRRPYGSGNCVKNDECLANAVTWPLQGISCWTGKNKELDGMVPPPKQDCGEKDGKGLAGCSVAHSCLLDQNPYYGGPVETGFCISNFECCNQAAPWQSSQLWHCMTTNGPTPCDHAKVPQYPIYKKVGQP